MTTGAHRIYGERLGVVPVVVILRLLSAVVAGSFGCWRQDAKRLGCGDESVGTLPNRLPCSTTFTRAKDAACVNLTPVNALRNLAFAHHAIHLCSLGVNVWPEVVARNARAPFSVMGGALNLQDALGRDFPRTFPLSDGLGGDLQPLRQRLSTARLSDRLLNLFSSIHGPNRTQVKLGRQAKLGESA